MRQNEHDGIRWLDWTDEAFQRAKSENKPVLLDISAVWCHWCHRLDKDTYSVPDIAEYIESNFIPIRVDTDKRPDINRRYNMGGWPTTAFLTPDGRVIGGGTYLPPDQMRQTLRDIRSFWEKSQGKATPEIDLPHPESIPIGILSPSIIDEVLGEIANNFDPIYGGFGSQPKFPNTDAHELALLKYNYSGNREFLKIATTTLSTVAKSHLHDHEMGGFFRYSTTRDWSIPHFEKMLEDNAKWLQLFLHAHQVTADEAYLETARGIVSYIDSWLCDRQNGYFFGSQDADEEYYSKSRKEREELKPPYVDKNLYTSWNALMISAYLEASFVIQEMPLREFALKSLDRLMRINYKAGIGMYHFYDGSPNVPNQLADQIQTVRALCDAYEATGDRKFLSLGEELIGVATSKLYDVEHGGFFDTVVDPNAPGFLSKPAKPLDENSVAARVLIRLHHLTGKDAYRKQAEDSLKRFVEIFPQFGLMAADYAMAVDAILNEPTMIRIVGALKEPLTKGLVSEAHRVYEPRRVIRVLDPTEDRQTIDDLGYRITPTPTAYICVGRVCTAPIAEPKQIGPELTRMVSTHLGD